MIESEDRLQCTSGVLGGGQGKRKQRGGRKRGRSKARVRQKGGIHLTSENSPRHPTPVFTLCLSGKGLQSQRAQATVEVEGGNRFPFPLQPHLIHLSLQKIKSQSGSPGRPVAEVCENYASESRHTNIRFSFPNSFQRGSLELAESLCPRRSSALNSSSGSSTAA